MRDTTHTQILSHARTLIFLTVEHQHGNIGSMLVSKQGGHAEWEHFVKVYEWMSERREYARVLCVINEFASE